MLEWPWYCLVKKNTPALLSDCIYLRVFVFGWLWHEHDLCDEMADTWLQTRRPTKQKISILVEKHKKEWGLMCLLLVLGVEENMQEVVGHVTEGVCRPLKVSK